MARKPKPPTTTDAENAETTGQNQPQISSVADDAAHLANIVVPDLDGDEIDVDAPYVPGDEPAHEPAPKGIDKEKFWLKFEASFSVPGIFIGPEWKPLAVQTEEREIARAASDAIHSLIEIWYPAILDHDNPTLEHILTALPFVGAKVMIVREIIRARRAPPARPPDQPPEKDGAEGSIVVHQTADDLTAEWGVS